MTKIERQSIADALNKKGATQPCHRCGTNNFSVIEGITNTMIQDGIGGGLVIGGPTVPAAVIACNNCGALTFHALGALGLLPQPPKEAE